MDSASILFHPTRSDGAAEVRRSRQLLAQLRGGWRPDEGVLATARHAEQWTVRRSPDSVVYQFVGHGSGHEATPDHSSLIVGSALAIAPDEGWALLASNAWVTLGTTLPQTPPFDPADVATRAETWLQARSS